MGDYEQFIQDSSTILDSILGKASDSSILQATDQGLEQGSNLNDLTNLFHFLLLDKHNVKKEIKDKLTAVYKIFRSPSQLSQPGPSESK